MKKSEFIDEVAARLGSKKAATEAVETFLDTVTTAVANGGTVAITGFGTFSRVERPERQARNPLTGATITVPATNVPKFKAGAAFKTAVKGQ